MNDAKKVRKFLMRGHCAFRINRSCAHTTYSTGYWNFGSEDIQILTDDAQDPRRLPTKANILGAIEWLVKGAKANDSFFFHC